MGKRNYNDPDGFRTCSKCLQLKEASSDFFHRTSINQIGFTRVCKICDNERRNENERQRKYHNVKRRCKTCEAFFYASLAKLNRGRRKKYKAGIYCSMSCVPHFGRGKSWDGKRKGDNNPNAILTEFSVREIKRKIKEGISLAMISRIFNVKPCTIYCIKANKTWAHIQI
jgi:hypothetical protein